MVVEEGSGGEGKGSESKKITLPLLLGLFIDVHTQEKGVEGDCPLFFTSVRVCVRVCAIALSTTPTLLGVLLSLTNTTQALEHIQTPLALARLSSVCDWVRVCQDGSVQCH